MNLPAYAQTAKKRVVSIIGKKHGNAGKILLLSLFLALIISAGILFMANEVFSLTASPSAVTLTLPEGADVHTVARILKENNLIHSTLLFRFYAQVRSWGSEYLMGEFTLDRAMSYDEFRTALAPKRGVRRQIRVTIPEGYTTDEIIDYFVSLGIGSREGFVTVIQNGGTFGYDFVEAIPAKAGRTYRLDGYLFPDTYFVYADSDETEIIQKLLRNFDSKFDEQLRLAAQADGFSVDEIVVLSSLVENEAFYCADRPGIAAVFRNRLQSDAFPFLESDATVKYAKETAGDKTPLSAEDLKSIVSPYNTYLHGGLPPGPICQPGLDSIRAAVYPAASNYFYFLSAKDKTTIFSNTYEEHLRAIAALSE